MAWDYNGERLLNSLGAENLGKQQFSKNFKFPHH